MDASDPPLLEQTPLAAKQATRDIPIVIIAGDLVETGIVPSLAEAWREHYRRVPDGCPSSSSFGLFRRPLEDAMSRLTITLLSSFSSSFMPASIWDGGVALASALRLCTVWVSLLNSGMVPSRRNRPPFRDCHVSYRGSQ